jgi:biuret amidohydrolase
MALLVYDMQAGIVTQLTNGPEIVGRVREVLEAAREGGFPVFFTRHTSLPKQLMGTFQLRQQMAWQRVESVEEVRAPFPREAPQTRIVPELEPLESEAVSDKIAMSAFEGTFLNTALRDLGIDCFAICGIATEVGIEPTVRHGADLGYLPVVIADGCGAGDEEEATRSSRRWRPSPACSGGRLRGPSQGKDRYSSNGLGAAFSDIRRCEGTRHRDTQSGECCVDTESQEVD